MEGDRARPVLGESGGGSNTLRFGDAGGDTDAGGVKDDGGKMLPPVAEEAVDPTEEAELRRLAVEDTKVDAEGRSIGRREISRIVLATRWRPSIVAGSGRRSVR